MPKKYEGCSDEITNRLLHVAGFYSRKKMAYALNIIVKLKRFTHCNAFNGVQHVNNDGD